MYLLSKLKNKYFIPEEYRKEFNRSNQLYNCTAMLFFCALTFVLLAATLLVSYFNQNSASGGGVNELELILPSYIIMLVVIFITFLILLFARKKLQETTWPIDVIVVVIFSILVYQFIMSAHNEISVTGIKNINVLVFALFVMVFFIRLHWALTISLQTIYTLVVMAFIFSERNSISNFMPSIVNMACAWVLAVSGTLIYWSSRLNSFLSRKKLEEMLSSDFLTRVHNRRGFDYKLECSWRDMQKADGKLTLFIIDIDYFKLYNDTYGHQEGDECLIKVAESISTSVRKNDFVARYGGEEFGAILCNADIEAAKMVAGRILKEVESKKMTHQKSDVSEYVTVSIGIATVEPANSTLSAMDVLRKADEALYMAKRSGRNKVMVHPDCIEQQ